MRPLGMCLLILAVVAGGLRGEETQGPGKSAYVFTLNGKPFTPETISLEGDSAHRQSGDLVRVGDLLLTLGAERTCHFVTTPEEDGRLLLQLQDGSKRVVGANVGRRLAERKKVVFNPLERLSPAEIRGLWGIRLDDWPEGVAQKLEQIDPARTCITVTGNVVEREGGRMRPLPAGVRYLNIEEHSNMGIGDYQPLAGLSQLRVLIVRAMTVDAFDARLIAQNQSLRYLSLNAQSLEHPESLARLKQMRLLDLAEIGDLTTVAFAGQMGQLKWLDVKGTGVHDLSPLAGLTKLEEVVASMAPVERLPDRPLPALRTLEVFSTHLSEPAVATFAKLNPKCSILFRWVEAFRQTVAGSTRIRVRSGGTCHRRPEGEKTLFEVTEAAKVRDVVDHICIDEKHSGFHCMCCGNPTFEFYQGERLVAMLGFHHGRSLRWPGRWPSDGMLTPESAEYLAKWLSENGVAGPLKERREEQQREQAMERRSARYGEILPAKVLEGLRTARSLEQAIAAFETGEPDAVQRAMLYLRLFGCDHASWNHYAGLDDLLQRELLPKVEQKTFIAAIRKGLKDPAAVTGAARWIFWEGKAESLGSALEEVLPELARTGLSHPRSENRRNTILALGGLKSPAAVRMLRQVLLGRISARELPKGEESEPGETVAFRASKFPRLEKCSERVCAGFLLAQLGDTESLPALRSLAGAAAQGENEVLQEAIAKLEGNRK